MSDRKETPDLLGDILANGQDDSDDRDFRSERSDIEPHDTAAVHEASTRADEPEPEVEGQPPGPSRERKEISQDLARQYKERIEQLEGERDQLGEQVRALNKQLKALEGQLAEAQTARLEVEELAATAEELETSQRKEEEPPSASDRVFTLEDQLKQLGDRDHWWQLWRRK